MSIDLRLNSRYLTKRLKILIFAKKLRVHCNLYVINDPPCNSAYAAKRLNKRLLLQWSCYSLTKIFETSLELTCDQVLVFLFWTVRGVLIQPWSKLLGYQRNSWSKWGIFLLSPSTPGAMLALCLQVSTLLWGGGDSRNRLLQQHFQTLIRSKIRV